MNRPSLYQNCNAMQRQDVKRFLEENIEVFQWRSDGRDRLIDIGSGSGDVLIDIVYPTLPSDFEELIGVDVNPKMVDFARKACSEVERVQFQVVDIGNKMLPMHLIERFDHVTSFFCLHWVQDQQTALENIYKLLRSDGGDGLLVFVTTHTSYDMYITQSKHPKWSQYMQEVKKFTSPLKFSSDPGAEFEKLCKNAGFSHYDIKVRDEVYFYESTVSFRNNMKAVCPYLDQIPEERHEEFMDDYINIAMEMNLQHKIENSDDYRYRIDYKVLIACVHKTRQGQNETVNGTAKKNGTANGNH